MTASFTSYSRFPSTLILMAGALLFPLSAFVATQTLYPYAWLLFLIVLCTLVVICRKPMIGIYALTLLYPLGSCAFIIETQQLDSRFVYFENILALMLLFVMVFRVLSHRHQRSIYQNSFKALSLGWCFFLLALFSYWAIIVVFRSDNYFVSLHGLWRFLSCFIIIAFLVVYLDSYDKFIKVMVCYCAVCVLFALSAIFATQYAFKINYYLLRVSDIVISLQIVLYNLPVGFVPEAVGMRAGVGLAAKHDLTMLLAGGILFAFFFIINNKSLTVRCSLVILILFFMTIIYQVFSRLSVAAMFLVALFLCLVIPGWRKSIFIVLAILIVLNLAGLFCSSLIRPVHMKTMESTQQKIQAVSSKSKFEPSSMAGRKYIWKKTIERIDRQSGLGSGPDSLHRDKSFGFPNGHNIFLTLAAEYGLPGVLLIVIFFLLVVHSAYKSVFFKPEINSKFWTLQVIFVAMAIHSIFVYSFDIPIFRKQLWFMIGLLIASINVAKKKQVPT